jgi:hypothetical protein
MEPVEPLNYDLYDLAERAGGPWLDGPAPPSVAPVEAPA